MKDHESMAASGGQSDFMFMCDSSGHGLPGEWTFTLSHKLFFPEISHVERRLRASTTSVSAALNAIPSNEFARANSPFAFCDTANPMQPSLLPS